MSAAGGKYIGDFNNKNTDFICSYHSGGKADGKAANRRNADLGACSDAAYFRHCVLADAKHRPIAAQRLCADTDTYYLRNRSVGAYDEKGKVPPACVRLAADYNQERRNRPGADEKAEDEHRGFV